MAEMLRQSPVTFDAPVLETETRDHWPVVLQYEDEGEGRGGRTKNYGLRTILQKKNLPPAGRERQLNCRHPQVPAF